MSKKHPSPSLPLRDLFQLRPKTVIRHGLDKLSGYIDFEAFRPKLDELLVEGMCKAGVPLTGEQGYLKEDAEKKQKSAPGINDLPTRSPCPSCIHWHRPTHLAAHAISFDFSAARR